MTMYNPMYPGMYQTPTLTPQQVTRVNGENGARAFQMAPNSSVLLLDENDPIVWLKTTDGAGYPSITPYTITPYQPAPPPIFQDLEARIKKLEDIIDAKSNTSSTEQRQSPVPNKVK